MSFLISDFFKSQKTLNRYKNCGFFGSYLDSFSDWLGRHKFSVYTIQRHISIIAHFSYSLEGIEPDIHDIDTSIQTFFFSIFQRVLVKDGSQRKLNPSLIQ